MENREILDALVIELLEKETLNKEEIDRIFADVKLRPIKPAWTGSDQRPPSSIPPVAVPAVVTPAAVEVDAAESAAVDSAATEAE